jgi:hypothetical protein
MVVKFGRAVREGETVNQDQVFRMLDQDTIHVPRVHKYFHDDRGIGYIVMDFMHGKPIDTRKVNHIEGIRKALQDLASFSRNFPGPLHSDEPVGPQSSGALQEQQSKSTLIADRYPSVS